MWNDWISKTLWNNDHAVFWSMAQTLIVLVSLVFIYRQIKAQVEQIKAQRAANMLMYLSPLDQKWDSLELVKSRYAVCKGYDNDNLEIDTPECLRLLGYFEELGAYSMYPAFELDIIWSMFSERIFLYWSICEDKIAEYRTTAADKEFFADFEKLKEKMISYSKQRNSEFKKKTPEQILLFAKKEIENLGARALSSIDGE
jgi:hypothetical protein